MSTRGIFTIGCAERNVHRGQGSECYFCDKEEHHEKGSKSHCNHCRYGEKWQAGKDPLAWLLRYSHCHIDADKHYTQKEADEDKLSGGQLYL